MELALGDNTWVRLEDELLMVLEWLSSENVSINYTECLLLPQGGVRFVYSGKSCGV